MSFIETPGQELRQGDICGVTAFPTWNVEQTREVLGSDGTVKQLLLPTHDRLATQNDQKLVVVCSHDCDIENPRQRFGLLLAPLVPIPAGPNETEMRNAIMNSGVLTNDAYEYINFFPLTINNGDQVVVDFSAITHFARARQTVDALLANKIAELTDEARADFRLKLGAFFGRP